MFLCVSKKVVWRSCSSGHCLTYTANFAILRDQRRSFAATQDPAHGVIALLMTVICICRSLWEKTPASVREGVMNVALPKDSGAAAGWKGDRWEGREEDSGTPVTGDP